MGQYALSASELPKKELGVLFDEPLPRKVAKDQVLPRTSGAKGLLHVNLFFFIAYGIPFAVKDEKNRAGLFPRRITKDLSPAFEIHGAGARSRPGL
jgi:hypothetical protein